MLANHAGLVVKHDVSELAEALARILRDDNLRGHLQSGCAKVTQELGWEGPVREMESLYARFASGEGTEENSDKAE